jgi:hypothetical protein
MARKTANASGLFSDSIWEASILASAPAPAATTTAITTGGIFTATFTAPNTSNKTTGVWLWFAVISRDYTITLQEATVDTACTVTVPQASLVVGWNYIRFPTPYQWTATTAGRYRFKIQAVSSNGGTVASASSLAIYMDTYDSVGTLAATTDDAWVGGHIGATTTTIDIEVSGTGTSIGSGTEKNTSSSAGTGRTGGAGLYIANGGRVWSDGSVANTLQVRGSINVGAGGEWDRPADPADFTVLTKTIIDCEVANGNYWFAVQDGGVLNNTGAVSDTPYAEYVSGTGTSGSHFLVDRDTDWAVGMELLIEGSAYNQIEKKFIKTVYNAREFQLSDTDGGAESALTHTHAATSTVAMITRNNIIEQTNSSFGSYFQNTNTVRANCNFDWSRWNDLSYASGVGGFALRPQSTVTNYDGSSDHMVFVGGNSNRNGWTSITTAASGTDTGLVVYLAPSTNTASGAITIGSSTGTSVNQTYNDFLMFASVSQSIIATSAYNNTFNNCRFIGCNSSNAAAGHALAFYNSGKNTFNDCRFNTTRQQAIYTSGAVKTVFNNCAFADIGTNTLEVYCNSSTYNEIVFNNCTSGSATLVSNHQNMLEGSIIGFHRHQDTNRNHRAYKRASEIYSSGSGLADTTADTTFDADSLAMKNTPSSATVYSNYDFFLPQRAGNTINVPGRLYKTSDFNGDAVMELYLDGSSTPDDSYTLSGSHSTWIPFNLSADYTSGTDDRNANLRLKVRGTLGSVYLDTLFNASKTSNPIGSLDLWQDGTPNAYLVSTVASASEIAGAVWSDTSTYDPGSKGDDLLEAKDSAELASIK